MAPKVIKPIKGTVLVLHGYAQNGRSFAIKASGIRKAFKKAGYHTIFVDGPLVLKQADMPFEVKTNGTPFEELNLRGWTHTQAGMFNIQPALDTVKSAYQEHGPFIGIMGFSQGAGVLGAILSRYNEIVGDDKALSYLKFALFYSGFIYENEGMDKYYAKKIEIPTLHIMGELDTVVSNDRTKKLISQCTDATILHHPGGHYVPSTKALLRKEIAWVDNAVGDSSDGSPKKLDAKAQAAKDKKELDDLAAQMANLGKA